MSNVINFGQEEQADTGFDYKLVYVDPTTEESVTETFTNVDAIMSNAFVGFADDTQTLIFAIPIDNMISIRRLDGSVQ